MESYVHRRIYRTKSNIYNERAFSKYGLTSVKPYFENILNLIELPLGSRFHNSPFYEKVYNCENFGRKSLLLTIELFF